MDSHFPTDRQMVLVRERTEFVGGSFLGAQRPKTRCEFVSSGHHTSLLRSV